MNYQIPEGFIRDPSSGLYFKDEIVTGQDNRPVRLVTWYDPNTGQFNPVYYEIKEESPPPAKPQSTTPKKSSNGKTIALIASAICVIALVTVGVFGFQLGWFNAFLGGENTAVLPDGTPSMSQDEPMPSEVSPSDDLEEELPPSSSQEEAIDANVSSLEVFVPTRPFEPFINNDEGLDIELINALGELLNVDMTITPIEYDFEMKFIMNSTAGIDSLLMPGFYVSEEYANHSTPYFTYEHYVISHTGIQDLEDLAGLRVGVQLDSFSHGIMRVATSHSSEVNTDIAYSSVLYNLGTELTIYDTSKLAIDDLENGYLDVVITNQVVAEEVSGDFSTLPLLYQEDDFEIYEGTIAVPKHNEELLNVINYAINTLKATGEIEEWILEYS